MTYGSKDREKKGYKPYITGVGENYYQILCDAVIDLVRNRNPETVEEVFTAIEFQLYDPNNASDLERWKQVEKEIDIEEQEIRERYDKEINDFLERYRCRDGESAATVEALEHERDAVIENMKMKKKYDFIVRSDIVLESFRRMNSIFQARAVEGQN